MRFSRNRRYRRMYTRSTTELMLPCSIEELCRRLTARMDRSFFGTRPVIGRIRGTRLTARKRIWYRNSFQTRLSAELIDRANQTLVCCSFSMHPLVMAFMAMWFVFLALVGGAIFIQSLIMLTSAPSRATGSILIGAVVPVAMLLFGAGGLVLGRWLARDEQAFLLNFVRTVGARASNIAHPPSSD